MKALTGFRPFLVYDAAGGPVERIQKEEKRFTRRQRRQVFVPAVSIGDEFRECSKS
jgi:hypothetical protein